MLLQQFQYYYSKLHTAMGKIPDSKLAAFLDILPLSSLSASYRDLLEQNITGKKAIKQAPAFKALGPHAFSMLNFTKFALLLTPHQQKCYNALRKDSPLDTDLNRDTVCYPNPTRTIVTC